VSPVPKREYAYEAFLAYDQELQSRQLWDDCDRVTRILEKIQKVDKDTFHNAQYNRIYVDEIQDYTQAQLALFFTFCKER